MATSESISTDEFAPAPDYATELAERWKANWHRGTDTLDAIEGAAREALARAGEVVDEIASAYGVADEARNAMVGVIEKLGAAR